MFQVEIDTSNWQHFNLMSVWFVLLDFVYFSTQYCCLPLTTWYFFDKVFFPNELLKRSIFSVETRCYLKFGGQHRLHSRVAHRKGNVKWWRFKENDVFYPDLQRKPHQTILQRNPMNKATGLWVLLREQNKETMDETLLWKKDRFGVCSPPRANWANTLEHNTKRMSSSLIIQQGERSQSLWKAADLKTSLQPAKVPLIHVLLARKVHSGNFRIIQIKRTAK